MSIELSKSVKCAIGEYLVLAELLKRGREAFIAQGPTQDGWDIVVIDSPEEKKKIIRVQVKAIEWPTDNRRTITLSKALKFDYMVVVLLNLRQPHSRYLVASHTEVNQFASEENEKRKSNARSWYIAKDFSPTDTVGRLENQWGKIQ